MPLGNWTEVWHPQDASYYKALWLNGITIPLGTINLKPHGTFVKAKDQSQ